MATLAARYAARPVPSSAPAVSLRVAARAASWTKDADDPGLAKLNAALDRARALSRIEPLLPFWRRDRATAALAWHEVEEAAGALARQERGRRAERLASWPRAERAAAAALERARLYAQAPGVDRRARSFEAVRAAALLDQARELAAVGRLAEALDLAAQSQRLTEPAHEEWTASRARFEDPAERRFWSALVEAAFRDAGDSGRHVLVDKLARRLEVYSGPRRLASFAVELGTNGLAQKVYAGDRTTPEGRYRVIDRRGPGRTRYHRALLLDYPNASDRRRWEEATRAGRVPRGAGPGSLIEIHGEGGRGADWTDGCLALPNAEMDRLFGLVPLGTPVTIVGTHDRDSLGG